MAGRGESTRVTATDDGATLTDDGTTPLTQGEPSPPQYDVAVANDEATPPAYDSIFGRLFNAAGGSSSGLRQSRTRIRWKTSALVCATVLMVLEPLYITIIGIRFWGDQYCKNTMVANYLTVAGLVALFLNTHMMYHAFRNRRDADKRHEQGLPPSPERRPACYYFSLLVFFFSFVWFIIGNVTVFRFDPGPHFENCRRIVYDSALGNVLLAWAIVGFACCCSCLFISLVNAASTRIPVPVSPPDPSNSDGDGELGSSAAIALASLALSQSRRVPATLSPERTAVTVEPDISESEEEAEEEEGVDGEQDTSEQFAAHLCASTSQV